MNLSFFTDPAIWAKFLDIVVDFGPRLLIACLMLLVGNWLIGVVVALLRKMFTVQKIDESLQTFFISLINIAMKILLVILAADQIGIHTTSIVAMFGAASLAIGLALQGSLANFAGGVLILFFKPYKIGDRIKAQGEEGVVREIQIFNTIIQTGDGKIVVMPNGAVSNGIITNMTPMPSRVDIEVIVEPETDLDLLRSKLDTYWASHPSVSKEIAPTVAILKIAEEGVTVAVRPSCHTDNYWGVYFDTMTYLKQLADEGVVQIPEKKLSVTLSK